MARTDYDDLTAFLADDAITTPPVPSRKHPNGKKYRIPSPDAETGLWLNSLANLGIIASSDAAAAMAPERLQELELDDADERNFHQRVLSTAYDEMMTDGVSWVVLQRLSSYAFAYYAISPEVANDAMRSGAFGGPKAPARPTDRKSPEKPSTPPAAPRARQGSAGSRTTPRKAGETRSSRGGTSSGTGR